MATLCRNAVSINTGFWMVKRSVADHRMAALAQGRDLYLGINK